MDNSPIKEKTTRLEFFEIRLNTKIIKLKITRRNPVIICNIKIGP
uniref:Uncharacterized protein n=1 Tax=uncultured organism TaxID=155900 RepID=A0A0G3VRY0_9ZZZZ|nr:hypothetical protein [uncultured organism]